MRTRFAKIGMLRLWLRPKRESVTTDCMTAETGKNWTGTYTSVGWIYHVSTPSRGGSTR